MFWPLIEVNYDIFVETFVFTYVLVKYNVPNTHHMAAFWLGFRVQMCASANTNLFVLM